MASSSRLKVLLLNRWIIVAHDLFMIVAAWLSAYWLRFNLHEIPVHYLDSALKYLLFILPIQAAVFWFFGLYRGVWRFASLPDLVRIIKSTGLGLVISMLVLFVFYRLEWVPRSVPFLYGMLLIVMLSGPRFVYRWLRDHSLSVREGERVLIVGAGQAGEQLARDLQRDRINSYQPVAFVDDMTRRIGQDIHGIPVLGPTESIPQIVTELGVDIILLAVPSAKPKDRRRLVALCETSGVPVRTVPQLDELMSGKVAVNQLREVSIEDLLGREPVNLDWTAIRDGLSGKTILVTGAGGSIGSELCRQIAQLQPARLVLLDNGEYNLYAIEQELEKLHPDQQFEICLRDVKDKAAVVRIFERFRPDIVFHAAAYKHVPMLEYQIREAVANNVIGTRNVAEAAHEHGCTEFVLISTDKAVNPANVMGTTKRFAELFCQNLNERSNTRYITVRFGNVLDSAGSVVPLFRKQIAAGGPVTVTHKDIERFFMTIPEACQLIMQAGVMGEGGEIFVLDMGSPVKISYLAEQMIRLSGKTPGEEIEITFTGLRPGEKLYEELFHDQESLQPTHHNKILLAKYRAVDWDELSNTLSQMREAVANYDEEVLFNGLCRFVPENRIQRDAETPGDAPIAAV